MHKSESVGGSAASRRPPYSFSSVQELRYKPEDSSDVGAVHLETPGTGFLTDDFSSPFMVSLLTFSAHCASFLCRIHSFSSTLLPFLLFIDDREPSASSLGLFLCSRSSWTFGYLSVVKRCSSSYLCLLLLIWFSENWELYHFTAVLYC